MRKLYVNINHVKIVRGGANALTSAVTDIDKAIEKLANETMSMHKVLIRYSATEQGEEYKRATDEVGQFAKKLSTIATDLNSFQHDIVALQVKIKKYERDGSPNATPRKLSIQKQNISVNTSIVEFHAEEMKFVVRSIEQYINSVDEISRELKSKKDSLGSVWVDPQYRSIFSPYIDEVKTTIQKGNRSLASYKADLLKRINDLT